MTPTPFTVQVPDETLADLHDRLARVRWPDEIPGAGWAYGTDLAYLKELVDYWRNGYDWRVHEAAMNRFEHYRVELDEVPIHYIHRRGVGPDPMPLVLTHGWPSSFLEMLPLAVLLTDPADFETWLSGSTEEAIKLARSYAADQMRIVQSGSERKDLLAA